MEPFADLTFTEVARFHRFEVVAPEFAGCWPDGPVAPYAGIEAAPAAGMRLGVTGAHAEWDDGAVVLEVAGVRRRRRRFDPRRVTAVGFALCERQATALVREPTGWRPLVTLHRDDAATTDLSWVVDGASEVRAGPFGMTGLRDPHLVQHADGTPYRRDGRIFVTWTCAGLGGFPQAHWGVFALDPERPEEMAQVAQIYLRRDGRVVGDHAGQLVRDGDRWLVMASSWGDFDASNGVHVRHGVSDADLLGGVHVVETEPTAMPTELSTWDAGFTRSGDGWLVSYVQSASQRPFRFHPALARTTAELPWEGLRPVGAVTDRRSCEGPVLVRRHGRLWLVASDSAERGYPVFDDTMRPLGHLDAPYPTNIPHPQLVELEDGGWLMLAFDGTPGERRRHGRRRVLGYGGHGDVVVMRSEHAPTGR